MRQSATPGNGRSVSSGDGGAGTNLAATIGGNGICHCTHVRDLRDQVNNIAQQAILPPNVGPTQYGMHGSHKLEKDRHQAVRSMDTVNLVFLLVILQVPQT